VATKQESKTAAFVRYQESVASALRYVQAHHNLLELHNLGPSLEILDAAGGNGLNTEFLLRLGHKVTLLDSDPEMLADARRRLSATGLIERCQLVRGTLEAVGDCVPRNRFDLILCHHALEYTDCAPRILVAFGQVAAVHGEISLVTINPVSEVIRAAVFRHDASLATSKINDLSYDAKWFGKATLYTLEQVVGWADKAGWSLGDFRAIRVLADYIPQERAQPQERELIALEKKLAGLEPYRRFGRYLQFRFFRSNSGQPTTPR
jgi:ubiquinone/menaquinone biosynthesis C-methylase UbiE